MNKNYSKLRTYVRPEVKTLLLDFQSVLASSGNPSITNPPMPWGPQKKEVPWKEEKVEE